MPDDVVGAQLAHLARPQRPGVVDGELNVVHELTVGPGRGEGLAGRAEEHLPHLGGGQRPGFALVDPRPAHLGERVERDPPVPGEVAAERAERHQVERDRRGREARKGAPLEPALDRPAVEAGHVDLAVGPGERGPHRLVAQEQPSGSPVAGAGVHSHALHELQVAEPVLHIRR